MVCEVKDSLPSFSYQRRVGAPVSPVESRTSVSPSLSMSAALTLVGDSGSEVITCSVNEGVALPSFSYQMSAVEEEKGAIETRTSVSPSPRGRWRRRNSPAWT
jgi:hypothetical protein